MSNILSNWIYIGSNAYDEYTFVPWLNKNVYRRTVDFSQVCARHSVLPSEFAIFSRPHVWTCRNASCAMANSTIVP